MIEVKKGVAHVYYAFEVGFAIELEKAFKLITAEKERPRLKAKLRISKYFEFTPPPVRVTQVLAPIEVIAGFQTRDVVEATLFDFGAISVCFKIPFAGALGDAVRLSVALVDNETLQLAAKKLIENIVAEVKPAINKLALAEPVEDYVVFRIEPEDPAYSGPMLVSSHPKEVASLLRAEASSLSDDEIQVVLANHLSYGNNDLVIVDWNSALVIDDDPDDILMVFEYANVALLEYCFLDGQLDRALDDAYASFEKSRFRISFTKLKPMHPALLRIGQFQIDSAVLFESVANALKLIGDEYLARLYRVASHKFGLSEWDASISRKLKTLESVYEKISDVESARRMEVLELIIILLIAISIILPFIPSLAVKLH